MLVGSGAVDVSMPLYVPNLRIGGASGLYESLSGTVMTSNHLAATGTFEWRRNGTTIFSTTTPGLDLTTSNFYVFPSGTENLAIGSTSGTRYSIASTSSGTTDDIALAVGGTNILTFTESAVVGDATVSSIKYGDQAITIEANPANGSVSAPNFSAAVNTSSGMYYDSANSALCMASNGKLSMAAVSATTSANVAICVASPPTTFNGGDGVVYIGEVIVTPFQSLENSNARVIYVNSDDDLRYVTEPLNENKNSTLNSMARRALVTLSAYTVNDATSDDLDGETWTDVNSAGVSGTTTGALNIPSVETTVMVIAQATWVSNATGYRRVSITTGAGHTVEATSTTAAVNGDVTSQTVTLVRRLESGDANLQFATQVYQNSTGTLDVDVTMTLVRLN
jgi:hypothetical protein